jgi:hypothetical protein
LGALCLWVDGLRAAPFKLVEQPATKIVRLNGGSVLVDFGRVAFGNPKLMPPEGASGGITVHFDEKLADGRVDRRPPGLVRSNKEQ